MLYIVVLGLLMLTTASVPGINGDGVDASVCALPMDIGICRASVPRFYFDAATGECSRFVYGGCQGNANNFATLDGCRQACSKK